MRELRSRDGPFDSALGKVRPSLDELFAHGGCVWNIPFYDRSGGELP